MLITYPIQMDLRNRGMTPVVYAVQNEGVSRAIELVLKDGGELWNVPTGTTAAIRFRKSDGKGGIYDTLPDDSPAYNIDGNKVTFYLAPQVLTSDGIATVQLVLMKGNDVLCSFGVHINVETDVSLGEQGSENYVNLTNLMMEQIENYFATHPDAGLSMLLLPNIDGEGVSSHNVYISDFRIPPGFVPKSGDLVLHRDGYLGYIKSIGNDANKTVNVSMVSPPICLDGKDGDNAIISVRFGISSIQGQEPEIFYDYVPNMTEEFPYLWAEFTSQSGLNLEIYKGVIGVYGVGEERVLTLIKANTPNWDASNGEAGYIRNRTHYSKLLSESITLGIYDWFDDPTGQYPGMTKCSVLGTFPFSALPGAFSCSFWGNKYEDFPFNVASAINLYGISFSFAFHVVPANPGYYEISVYTSEENTSYVESIKELTNIKQIAQLSDAFIPNTIARVADINNMIEAKLAELTNVAEVGM